MSLDKKDPDRFAKALLRAWNTGSGVWEATDEQYRNQYRRAAANVLAVAEYEDLRLDPVALRLKIFEVLGHHYQLPAADLIAKYILTGEPPKKET